MQRHLEKADVCVMIKIRKKEKRKNHVIKKESVSFQYDDTVYSFDFFHTDYFGSAGFV